MVCLQKFHIDHTIEVFKKLILYKQIDSNIIYIKILEKKINRLLSGRTEFKLNYIEIVKSTLSAKTRCSQIKKEKIVFGMESIVF